MPRRSLGLTANGSVRMREVRILYAFGVLCAAGALLLSPWPWTALLAVAAGLVWASYDLVDVTEDEDTNGKPPSTPPR